VLVAASLGSRYFIKRLLIAKRASGRAIFQSAMVCLHGSQRSTSDESAVLASGLTPAGGQKKQAHHESSHMI